jgi:hypothetical protein
MKPTLLKASGYVSEIKGSRPGGFLPVKIVTGDATETRGTDHLITRIFRLLNISDSREQNFFEVIDLAKQAHEVTDIRLSELGHRRVEV